jgi:hypothetical protein
MSFIADLLTPSLNSTSENRFMFDSGNSQQDTKSRIWAKRQELKSAIVESDKGKRCPCRAAGTTAALVFEKLKLKSEAMLVHFGARSGST